MTVFQAFIFPGKPDPPLISFASRLLSVSANSASCERLFSVFGATLTKLRNRLGVSVLTELTELKMHIRDGHLRDQTARSRLKRSFKPPTGPADTQADANILVDTPSVATRNHVPSSSDPGQEAAPQTPVANVSEFRALVQQEVEAVAIDDLDNDPLFTVPSFTTRAFPLIPLSTLFDFSNRTWSDILSRHAEHNFDEELALYELLDLDAAGEDDIDVELDETTTQTLIG
jgi:hypothetical protein